MTKLYINIGVAGSGKSTYTKKMNNIKIVSSDEIRKELFGDLLQKDPQEVFKEVHRRIFEHLNNGYDVAFDATNLNRKKRSHLYREVKRLNEDIEIISLVFLKPLKDLIKQNNLRDGKARVPEYVISRMYKSLQVPRIGIDCDKIERAYGSNFADFIEEYTEYDWNTSHDSTYHEETVGEHIDMTMQNALKTNDKQLFEVARFHDLGKFVAKNFKEGNVHANFFGHEYVSAMYYLSYMDTDNKEQLEILETIYQHMNAHFGITNKIIERNGLTNKELDLIEAFAKIDDVSRVTRK